MHTATLAVLILFMFMGAAVFGAETTPAGAGANGTAVPESGHSATYSVSDEEDGLPGLEPADENPGSGYALGGMFGLSASGHLQLADNTPFIDVGLGLSGYRLGLGQVWFLNGDAPWLKYSSRGITNGDSTVINHHFTANAAFGARVVFIHRWYGDDIHRPEAAWGIRTHAGNYLGVEGLAVVCGFALTPGVYTRGRGAVWAVSYGVGY